MVVDPGRAVRSARPAGWAWPCRVRHVQVDAGGAQRHRPEQQLDAAQIHPSFEQMSRIRMPNEMGIDGLFDLDPGARWFANMARPCG
jgi:hypothetical protein